MKSTPTLFLLLLAGCGGGLGPQADSSQALTRPQLHYLPGSWAAAPATTELLRQLGYAPPTTYPLTLRPDSTFTFAALPDCLPLPFGRGGAGKLLPAAGRWQVRRDDSRWEVLMSFKKGELYPHGVLTNYRVTATDSTYQLYTYLGDPDGGQQLLWEKSRRK